SIDVDNSLGPRGGWLYCVFADNRNGDCDVFLTKSTNAGLNWSAPVRVNNDGIGNGKIQYWPSIAVDETGNIAILFMDTRNTPGNTIIEAYLARSYDGGVTFTNELVSSEQSPTNTPGSNVRFGDYVDIDYLGENIVPVWTDERLGGFNMDIYSAEITEVLAVDPKKGTIPSDYTLYQNFPNPFNPSTTIWFNLPKESNVTLSIYNALGQLIETPIYGTLRAGTFSVIWNASNYSSGVYFYRLNTSSGFAETKKMILTK